MAVEGNESFQIQIRTGSISGPIVATSSTITVIDTPSTYSISQTATSVNEGGSVTFTLTTTNVVNGTTIYWNTSGTASAADFSDGVSTGSLTVNSNSGSITRTLSADLTTESSETFAIRFYEDSARTILLQTSATVTISDTSTTPTPTYSITPASSSVSEGQQMTWTISTTNFGSGTLYWTNSGTTNASDFTDGLNSGSITITNNAGTLTKTLSADLTTEGSETIVIQLRTGSTSGTVVQTASTVTVADTSVAPPPTTSAPPPTTSAPPPTTSAPPPTTSAPPPVVPPPVVPPSGAATWVWSSGSGNTSTTWTVPANVTSINIGVIGPGSNTNGPENAGGGGGLAYYNNVPVTPGEVLTIIYGAANQYSQVKLPAPRTSSYLAAFSGYYRDGQTNQGGPPGSGFGIGIFAAETSYTGGYGGPDYTIGINGDRYISNAAGGGNAGWYSNGGRGGWEEVFFQGPTPAGWFNGSGMAGGSAGGGGGVTEAGNGGFTSALGSSKASSAATTPGTNATTNPGYGTNGTGASGGVTGGGGAGSKDFAGKLATRGGAVNIRWGAGSTYP